MTLMKTAAAFGILAMATLSTVASAEATRAAAALPAAGKVISAPKGVRGSRKVAQENSVLAGLPLLLVIAAAGAVTVGAVAVASDNNDDSPGG